MHNKHFEIFLNNIHIVIYYHTLDNRRSTVSLTILWIVFKMKKIYCKFVLSINLDFKYIKL